MNKIIRNALSAGLLILSTIGAADAALITHLSFTEPTGTVSPTDSIDLWVTLSIDPLSDPLMYDRSSPFSGLPSALIPTETTLWNPDTNNTDTVAFASYTDTYLGISQGCSGTFTNGCSADEYRFSFASLSPGSFNSAEQPFIMNPGESRNFLVGTFIPDNGAVTLGDYTYYHSTFSLIVEGLSEDGDYIIANHNLAETCSWGDSTCEGFTRTVSAVPVPAAIWLFGSGLIGLVGLARRKKV